MKLLVVDDEPLILRGICRMIGELFPDMEVRSASSAMKALDLMLIYHPDIVFTDIQMPVMDGLEFIRRAQEAYDCPNYFLLTNYAQFQYAREAITLGVRGYLLKPIESEEIQQSVELVRQEKQANEQTRPSKQKLVAQDEAVLAYRMMLQMEVALKSPGNHKLLTAMAQTKIPQSDAVANTLRNITLATCSGDKGSHKLRSLLILMLSNSLKNLSLMDISRQVKMHPNYISTLMKKQTGISYSKFGNYLRVAKAQKLLMENNAIPVSEICGLCGFESTNHFHHVFKQITGQTPNEYRTKEKKYEQRQTNAGNDPMA